MHSKRGVRDCRVLRALVSGVDESSVLIINGTVCSYATSAHKPSASHMPKLVCTHMLSDETRGRRRAQAMSVLAVAVRARMPSSPWITYADMQTCVVPRVHHISHNQAGRLDTPRR